MNKPITIVPPKKTELTHKGFTNRIRISPHQTVNSLMKFGFTNHDKPTLYYSEMVDKNVSFNLRVSKETLEIQAIDILDENWLQPFDYQSEIISGNPSGKAKNTYHKVNLILSKLQKEGIIEGFEKGMYI